MKQDTNSANPAMGYATDAPTVSKSDANPKATVQSSDKANPVGDAESAPRGMYKPTKTSY